MNNTHIYEWCKSRFEYYAHSVPKTIHELWDDVRIMLAKSDRVKGDYSFFATFMFWQCQRHETVSYLVKLEGMDTVFCADLKNLYHPLNGVLDIKDYTVQSYSSTGGAWKLL